MIPAEPKFLETNSGSPSCHRLRSTREIPNVQPEPESGPAESGPAEPEPESEARPAAGRRPEARTAAARSEPSGQAGPEPQSAGEGWTLVRARIKREHKKV